MSLPTSVSAMRFHIELMFVSKVIKSHFKGLDDKQNFTLMVISYEIYETSLHFINFISNDHSCKSLYIPLFSVGQVLKERIFPHWKKIWARLFKTNDVVS